LRGESQVCSCARIHAAQVDNQEAIIGMLTRVGANLEGATLSGATALGTALAAGSSGPARVFAGAGTNQGARDHGGETLFLVAVGGWQVVTVQAMCSLGFALTPLQATVRCRWHHKRFARGRDSRQWLSPFHNGHRDHLAIEQKASGRCRNNIDFL
jgi:hypothetical protein